MTNFHSAAQRVHDISTELLRLYDKLCNQPGLQQSEWALYNGAWTDLRPALADLRSALQQPMDELAEMEKRLAHERAEFERVAKENSDRLSEVFLSNQSYRCQFIVGSPPQIRCLGLREAHHIPKNGEVHEPGCTKWHHEFVGSRVESCWPCVDYPRFLYPDHAACDSDNASECGCRYCEERRIEALLPKSDFDLSIEQRIAALVAFRSGSALAQPQEQDKEKFAPC